MPRSLSVYRNALISLAIKLGGSGLLLSISIYISRTFGADSFGIFSLFISLLLPLSITARLGLENNLMRLVAKSDITEPVSRHLFHQTALVALITGMGMATIAYTIGLFLPNSGGTAKFTLVLPWLAIGLPFHALLFCLIHYLRGRHRIFISMSFENIVLYAVFLAWMVAMTIYDATPSIPAGMALSSAITLLLGLLVYSRVSAGGQDEGPQTLPTLKERLRESLPMLTTSLSTIAFITVDVFILSLFLDAHAVGVYAAAAKLVAFISFPLIGVIGVIAPRLSALDNAHDRVALQTLFRQTTGFVFWTSLPIILAIVLFPEFLLGLFGEGFKQAKDVIFVLLLGHVATIMLGPVGYLLWMTDHAQELQRVTLMSLSASVIFCLVLIPLFGIMGAAIAITSGLLIKSFGSWQLVRKLLEFDPLYLPWGSLIHVTHRKP